MSFFVFFQGFGVFFPNVLVIFPRVCGVIRLVFPRVLA